MAQSAAVVNWDRHVRERERLELNILADAERLEALDLTILAG